MSYKTVQNMYIDTNVIEGYGYVKKMNIHFKNHIGKSVFVVILL